MSQQSSSPGSGGSPGYSGAATPAQGKTQVKFNTQETAGFRQGWPEWMRQLPRTNFPKEPNINYQLVDRQKLRNELVGTDPAILSRIEDDLNYMEHELSRLFRDRDYEAKAQQNRYRLYQIAYMLLAAGATLIGALQALALNSSPNAVPAFAFMETVVALLTTYLATISGREAPLPLWLTNRRRAEHLRREFFRFLMNMPPYDTVEGYQRRMMLSTRAADINRGIYPDKQAEG